MLLIITPIVPILIIFKSVHLTFKIKKMVANWRRTHSSPSSAWMEINIMEQKNKNVKDALFKMKNAETNLEGFVQLFVLLCFYLIPLLWPRVSGLGPEFEKSNSNTFSAAWVVLILSPVMTLISNIIATISAMDISKQNQISFKSKIVLAFYLLLQWASHMFLKIPTVLASLSHSPAISPTYAALLISLPILVHWCCLLFWMKSRIRSLPDIINHLVSNMWLVTPARIREGQREIHKSREQACYILLVGLNMMTTAGITAWLLMDERPVLTSSLFQSASQEFLALAAAPAIGCLLLSCVFLVIYYRYCHNWRLIGSHRDFNCCCLCCCCSALGRLCTKEKPITGEIPFWEKVSITKSCSC